MKKAMQIAVMVLALAATVGMGATLTVTDVASHATPALVSEVNSGFAEVEAWVNANVVTNTSGTLTVGGAFTAGSVSTTGTLASGVATVTGVINTSVGLDGVGAVDLDYGSADITDHTFVTDGTGDAEVVLPDDSIGDAEIAFDEVTGADLTLTDCGDIVGNDVAVDSLEDDSVAAAVAVTNGGSYQLEGLVAQLNSSGAATGATNAITLLALDATDEGAVFFIVNTGSNAISVAQSGTWAGSAIVVEEKGGAAIVATASNVFYSVGRFSVE